MITYPHFLGFFVEQWFEKTIPLSNLLIDLEFHLDRQQWHERPKYKKERPWNHKMKRAYEFLEMPTEENFELYMDEVIRIWPYFEGIIRNAKLANR